MTLLPSPLLRRTRRPPGRSVACRNFRPGDVLRALLFFMASSYSYYPTVTGWVAAKTVKSNHNPTWGDLETYIWIGRTVLRRLLGCSVHGSRDKDVTTP